MMGIEMYLPESEAQAAATEKMVQNQLEALREARKALEDLANSQEDLKGAAYDSTRMIIAEVYLPLEHGAELLLEKVAKLVRQFPTDYVGNVSGESLKEDVLLADIAKFDSQINMARSLLDSASKGSLSAGNFQMIQNQEKVIAGLEDARAVLQKKLDDLRDFNAKSPQIFADIAELAQAVTTGMVQVNQAWDTSKGVFVKPENLDWKKVLTKFDKKDQSEDKTGRVAIINSLERSYGFDRETATTLFELQQAILKRAKKEGWKQQDVIYEFNRIVASFVYDATRWHGVAGTIKSELAIELITQYGISETRAYQLQKNIVEQHNKSATDKTVSKDFAHEAVQLSTFTDKSKGTYFGAWLANFVSDLANSHKVNSTDPIVIKTEKYEVSFKGDIDSSRYDDGDFNSDLDALNGYKRMSAAKLENVFKVSAAYTNAIYEDKLNRVHEFYKTMGSEIGDGSRQAGKEYTKMIVEADTVGSLYITKGNYDTEEELQRAKNDFYDYLERGEEKNVRKEK